MTEGVRDEAVKRRTAKRIAIGVDGGTSATECVVIGADNAVLGASECGPTNDALSRGMHARVANHLCTGIGEALKNAGIRASDVDAVGLNLSGRREHLSPANARAWLALLDFPSTTHIHIDDDMLPVWALAGFPDPAVVVLAGTYWGSTAIVDGRRVDHPLDVRGLDVVTGALGEGSTMGSRAIAHAISAAAAGAPTRLSELVGDELGARTVEELVAWARANEGASARAALLPLVAAAARVGDAAATSIIEDGGRGLGEATSVIVRLTARTARSPVSVILGGNAWSAGACMMNSFALTLHAACSVSRLMVCRDSLALGAALLARRAASDR